MIEAAIAALLLADATVAGMIATRLYPLVLPEDESPTVASVVYQVVSDIPEYTLADGVVSQKARVQFDAWAPTALAAKQLANAIRAVLEPYAGIAGGVAIGNAWITAQMSTYEEDLRRYRVQTDFMILYAIPS